MDDLHDCMEAGGRATQGAVAEDVGSTDNAGRLYGYRRSKMSGTNFPAIISEE